MNLNPSDLPGRQRKSLFRQRFPETPSLPVSFERLLKGSFDANYSNDL
jgi:hypothetical protein